MLGVHSGQSNNLSRFAGVIRRLLQSNSYLRQQGRTRSTRVAGRSALITTLTGTSPIYGGTEVVTIYTLQLRNGQTLYMAAVTPQADSSRYNSTFRTVMNSVRLND